MRLSIVIVPIIVASLVLGGLLYFGQFNGALAGGPQSTNASAYCSSATASTSVTYLTAAGAGSDCIISTEGLERISINTQLDASSTATVLVHKLYASQGSDCDTSPSGCDWFSLPNVTEDSAVASTIGASTTAYTYTPLASGITRFSFLVSPTDHKWFKLTTTLTGANGSIWRQIALTKGY